MQALELLSDPDRLKKALDEIKAEQKTLEDRIALAGTAREIVEKETRIDHELTEAREATTTAREEAEATRVKAEAEAEEIVATATSEAADLNESAQATLKDAQGRRDAALSKHSYSVNRPLKIWKRSWNANSLMLTNFKHNFCRRSPDSRR
jgi:uncharacterized protein with von Willebrand factor type A (vWA) domain